MTQKRFSREGFKPLEGGTHANRDVTIDIPLTTVTSRTGARKVDMLSPGGYQQPSEQTQESPNEKSGLFHRKSKSNGPGGRRRRIEETGREATDPEDGTMTSMGKFYEKVMNFSFITRYFLYVLPLALAIAVPIVIGATAAKSAEIGGVKIVWFFTWIEVVWISLWVSKLVTKILPPVFMFLVGIVSPGVRKYALVLKALEIPLSLVGWSLCSLATFIPIMTLNPDIKNEEKTNPAAGDPKEWEKVLRNILAAALVSTLILLAEKLIVQLISISYHQTQFSIRIKDSKRKIHLLGLLYDASRALFPEYSPEFVHEDYIINDSLNLTKLAGSKRPGMHKRSGSATPMRVLQNVGRMGDAVIGKFGNIAQEITGKQVFNPNSAHAIVIEALEKTAASEALARRIWMSLVVEGKDALYEEDIIDVLGRDRKIEAQEAFDVLDRDGNGDISMDEMVLTVCEFSRERKAIANSMHDVDQAIHVLDNLLVTIAFILMIFIFVAFLNKSFTTTLATAGTSLLSLSFVFAATCQEVLGSCIFLFVKHPFDVGDNVEVSGERMIVEQISLLFTVFRSVKDYRTKQVPNIVLNGVWIDNVTRSKAMREQITLNISFDTSLEDIQLLKNELTKFVLDKDNSRDFQPEVNVSVLSMTDMTKLELQIDLVHKSNWSNDAIRASRRSKFMCALALTLHKIPIFCPGGGGAAAGDPANPSYSVSISNAEALENKQKFADTKEKKRMVPTDQMASVAPIKTLHSPIATRATGVDFSNRQGLTPVGKDSNVIDTLNARPAASDPARDQANDYFRQETAAAAVVNNDISPSQTPDERRGEIEEVREMLRRESTTGKRRGQGPSGTSIPIIREDPSYSMTSSSGFSPVEVPQIRVPAPRSDSRPGTSGGNNATPPTSRQPVEYHEYDFTPQPLTSQTSPTATPYNTAGAYQSNNPYHRATSAERSYGMTPRRPIGGNGNGSESGRSTPQ